MEEKSVRETIKEELKKLSGLTWKERLGYVWDYYKPLMVAVIVAAMVISVAVTAYRNTQIDKLLCVYLINANSYQLDGTLISDEFAEYLGGIGKDERITVDPTILYDPDDVSQYAVASQMKLIALLGAGEIDMMILDEKAFEAGIGGGVYQELSGSFDEGQLSGWEGRLVEDTDSESGEKGIYAIEVQDSPVLQRYNAYPAGKLYAVMVPGSENLELCRQFVNFLLGQ